MNSMAIFLIPGSDMYNHFTCMFLVSVDWKYARNYDYVSEKFHKLTCSEVFRFF